MKQPVIQIRNALLANWQRAVHIYFDVMSTELQESRFGSWLRHEFVTITGHNNLPSFWNIGERVLAWVRLHGDQILFKNPENEKKKETRKDRNTEWKRK